MSLDDLRRNRPGRPRAGCYICGRSDTVVTGEYRIIEKGTYGEKRGRQIVSISRSMCPDHAEALFKLIDRAGDRRVKNIGRDPERRVQHAQG